MSIVTPAPKDVPRDEELVRQFLAMPESRFYETKRVGDNKKKIETMVAFANTDGGLLVLGIEDDSKAKRRDRLFGIQENPESVDELRRLLRHRITPPFGEAGSEHIRFIEIGCSLRGGSVGSVMAVQVAKSPAVHSVVDGGTFVRLDRSNRQISAVEITELSMRRGSLSAVAMPVDVPFELLETSHWREYATQRRLTRPLPEAMRHLGLARNIDDAIIQPTRAAVLLFAEEPSGLLDSKCAIRIFHYKGDSIQRSATSNLVRPPITVGGPLIVQIRDARDAVLRELSSGVQVGPLGFEIAQRYPVRVIQEAITNAVVHRDYHISADIQIRLFSDRIEVESPGSFPGAVTSSNVGIIGSRPRNRAIVDHLREFPVPPNLDAGEGVPMMRQTMLKSELYPPLFLTRDRGDSESILVQLRNQDRPSTWDQVEAHLERSGSIGNAEVRKLLATDDPVRTSRQLKSWVELGLLDLVDPDAPKRQRRYRRAGSSPADNLFSGLSSKEEDEGHDS